MRYNRSIIEVSIRLDPIPGWNHEPEDMVKSITASLPAWYYPKVKLLRVVREPSKETERLWKESQEVKS